MNMMPPVMSKGPRPPNLPPFNPLIHPSMILGGLPDGGPPFFPNQMMKRGQHF